MKRASRGVGTFVAVALLLACFGNAFCAELGEVLLQDDFDTPRNGPIDVRKWKVEYGKPPVCDGGRMISARGKIWHSRMTFAEPVSVEFLGVYIAELPRSSNNQMGLAPAPGGHGPDMVVWAFTGSPLQLVPMRRVSGATDKAYLRDGHENGIDLSSLPDTTKPENAVNLRIDWWPGKMVRYYLNDKLVADFRDHVLNVAVPVSVRCENVGFRIGSIKVTRIVESAEQVLAEFTEARRKAIEARKRMIAEYHEARKAAGLPPRREVTDNPKNEEFNEGKYVNSGSLGAVFDSIGFVPDGQKSFFFVQLTDTHVITVEERDDPELTRWGNTTKAFIKCVDEINSMRPRPAFVVVTGDMAYDNKLKQLQRFKKIIGRLNPAIDFFPVQGNHDSITRYFREVFPGREIHYSFNRGDWHFIALFTGTHGNITRDQYAWLQEDLEANSEKPTMIFEHHPMLKGWPSTDPRRLREKIFHLMKAEAHLKVRWMFSGHWHMNFLAQCKYDGLPPVNLVTTNASSPRRASGEAGYRLICVAGDKVQATIYKSLGDNRFRIDPPPEEWPIYFPPAPDFMGMPADAWMAEVMQR